MTKVRVMHALAAALLITGCGQDGGPTDAGKSGTMAKMRFVNAATGMAGSGGFTTNGQFAAGSALPFGQSTQACPTVAAGPTSFGFGAANTSGTGVTGTALATLAGQSVTAGGNYTLVAAGAAPSPTLFLLDNAFTGPMTSNQAAVRFVNLAPGTGATPNDFTVLKGVLGQGHSLVEPNIAVGAPTTFATVTSGANTYTILKGHETVISGSAATLSLQPGGVTTVAIIPDGTSEGFRLVAIPRCS